MRHPIASRSCDDAAIRQAAKRASTNPKLAKAIVANLVATIVALVKSSMDDFKGKTPEQIKDKLNTMPIPGKFKTDTFANQVEQFTTSGNLNALTAMIEKIVNSLIPGGKSKGEVEIQAAAKPKRAMDKQWILEQAVTKVVMENPEADLDKVSGIVSELTGFSVVDCVQAITLMQVDANPSVQTQPLQDDLDDARGSQTPDMPMGMDLGFGDDMGMSGMDTPVADEMDDLGPDEFEMPASPDEVSIEDEVETEEAPENSGEEVSVDEAPEENPVAGLRLSSQKKAGMNAYDVFLGGKCIDTVFDNETDPHEVKRSLVNHDGYDSGITVRRSRKPRRTPAKGMEASQKAAAYGDKRDYPKIEIFVNGEYKATTTWAKTVEEALTRYKEAHPEVKGTLKGKRAPKNASVKEPVFTKSQIVAALKTASNPANFMDILEKQAAGFKYITYGLTEGDLERRNSQPNFRPVGMNHIVETEKPKVTPAAIEKAMKSGWANYVAVVTYKMDPRSYKDDADKEVDFRELPKKAASGKKAVGPFGTTMPDMTDEDMAKLKQKRDENARKWENEKADFKGLPPKTVHPSSVTGSAPHRKKRAEAVSVKTVEDTVESAVTFIEDNATKFEDANVAEVQTALIKAGFSREVTDKAITDLLGPDATQALGTPVKVLLEN